jgi:hypothetical protein
VQGAKEADDTNIGVLLASDDVSQVSFSRMPAFTHRDARFKKKVTAILTTAQTRF